MNIRAVIPLVLALLSTSAAIAAQDYRDPNFDYFVSGDPEAPRAAHTEFGLALFGGGGRVDAAFRFLAERGGRGHMLILRAVSDDSFDADSGDYGRNFINLWGGAVSAETIVFHNRKASFDPRVIRALKNADAIFLAGGDQSNYVRYWKGTPVQKLLNAHVRANRPIGGSSAGLAILGHYSYTAMDGGSLESKAALKAPLDPSVTLEDDFLHFRRMERVITDTHFGRRARLGRLIVFLARIEASHPREPVLGIGVDERSALLVDADGSGRLAADSAGSAWIVQVPAPAPLQPGQALTLGDIRITRMDLNSRIDLEQQRVEQAAAQTVDAIKSGQAVNTSFASPILMRDVVPGNES